jgi:Tfp pilus assembly protein PilV
VERTSRSASAVAPRQEGGFAFIEVIVSAVLVVLVSLGVYAGIDGASATSGINKNRSVASGIAQQDQDRMRSMTVNELSNYRGTTTSTVGGIDYTIASSSSWVTDSTGSASCTGGSTQADYLRIASSVTWANMTVAPVTVESVIAPPNGSFGSGQGSLAVQVRDRNGNGVPGVTVNLTGPQGYADVTNSSGCVLWGYLPVGNYTVGVSRSGFVDPSGVTAPTKSASVVGEATSTVAFDYDAGGQIQGLYQSWNGGSVVPANGTAFTASNPNLTVPLAPFGDGAPHTSFTTGLVYPFTVSYSVYAGSCAGANPTTYALPAQTALVQPGLTTNVALREPPIDLTVVNGPGASPPPVVGAIVKLAGTASGCGALPARASGAGGLLTDTAFPYGTYTFCVQSGGRKQTVTRTGVTTLANTTPIGIPAAAATVNMNGAPAGACP